MTAAAYSITICFGMNQPAPNPSELILYETEDGRTRLMCGCRTRREVIAVAKTKGHK